MRKRNTFKGQHLDRLLQIMGQNIPRPQQSFGSIREVVERLLPEIYSELTENLQPLGLVEISDYRFRIGSEFTRLQLGPWRLRLEHELFPRKEHQFSKSYLEKHNFRLEKIFLPEEEGDTRKQVIELCHLSVDFFLDVTTEIEKFLRSMEEMELQLEDLRTGVPSGLENTYADWCSRFWEDLPREGQISEDPKVYEKSLQLLDTHFEALLREIDRNIARHSPEESYRFLLRLHHNFSRYLESWEGLNTQPAPELILENLYWLNLEDELKDYCEQVIEYLSSITLNLEEKLGEVVKKIREEGSAV